MDVNGYVMRFLIHKVTLLRRSNYSGVGMVMIIVLGSERRGGRDLRGVCWILTEWHQYSSRYFQ